MIAAVRSEVVTLNRRIFRNRHLLLWIILVPLLLALICQSLVTLFESETQEQVTIYYQDRDGSSLFADVVYQEISDRYPVTVIGRDEDPQVLIDRILSDEQSGYVVFLMIPNYFDSYVLHSMTAHEFDAGIKADGLDFTIKVLTSATTDLGDGKPHCVIHGNESENDLFSTLRRMGPLNDHYFPSILSLTSVMVVSSTLLGLICEEKESGTSALLSRCRRHDSVRLPATLIVSLELSVVSAALVIPVNVLIEPAAIGLHTMAGYVLVALFGGLFGLIVSEIVTDREVSTLANTALIMPVFLFSGCLFPEELVPDLMGYISRLLPLTHMLDLMRGTEDVLISAALSLIGLLLMMIIWKALRIYRA